MMTATIFTILKVAGLILLVVLLVLLTVLVLVLAVPVRYRVAGTFYGKPEGKAVVSWLCHLLSCQVSYTRELEILVRILGIPIWIVGGKEKKKPALPGTEGDEVREEVLTDRETGKPEPGQTSAGGKPEPGQMPAGEKHQDPGKDGVPQSGEASVEKHPDEEDRSGPEQERNKKKEKKASRFSGDRKKKHGFSFSGFCDKLKKKIQDLRKKVENVQDQFRALTEKKDQLTAFLKDKGNQAAFLMVKDRLMDLLKHIFPKKCKGRFRFGFDDPYDTGRILTYAAPFYGLYRGKVELIPVFEEQVLEGELEVGGRVRLGYLVFVGIRILANRNFRILLKRIRRK